MVRAILAVVFLALAAMGLPGGAHAQDQGEAAFAEFRDVCLASQGDADDALAKLRGRGWVPGPDELAKSMQQALGADVVVLLNFDFETLAMKTSGGMGPALGLIGVAPPNVFDGAPIQGPFCAIAPLETNPEPIIRGLRDHFGFDPYEAVGEGALWIYTQQQGVAAPATSPGLMSEADAVEFLRATPHFFTGVSVEDSLTIIMFMRIEL